MGSVDLTKYFILILSAGIGKRMGTFGKNLPKAILKKNNKTLISSIISKLSKNKLKKIHVITGYKNHLIIKELANLNIKFKCIFNKNFKNYGSIYSWYLSQKDWRKEKKNFILLHSDLFFDEKFLVNIFKSKKKNIIGIRKFQISQYHKKNLYVCSNKKNIVTKIAYGRNLNKKEITGQVLCINKLSNSMMHKFYKFCKKKFAENKKLKKQTWELLMNDFIIKEKSIFYTLPNQNYYWFNINTQKEYLKLLKFKSND